MTNNSKNKTKNSDHKPLIIAITGPTASGKTDLAIELSQHLPIELINMDSAQVYCDMNIGTAKINATEQKAYPHHLMNIITPEQSYSAAKFVEDVYRLANSIHERGNIPLVVGGTILYYKALVDGLANLPDADTHLRTQLREEIAEHGPEKLLQELQAKDPETAKKLQPHDTQRLVRFIEIIRLTGKAPSLLFSEQKNQQNQSPFQFFHICFFPNDRNWLHKRIEQRFDTMLDTGLVDEVKSLRQKYTLSPELPSMRCAGYRQVWDYLEGAFDNLKPNKNNKHSNTAYQEMRDRGIFSTRQLAKRQITWLRKIPADITLEPKDRYQLQSIIDQIKTHTQSNKSINI